MYILAQYKKEKKNKIIIYYIWEILLIFYLLSLINIIYLLDINYIHIYIYTYKINQIKNYINNKLINK